MLGQGENLRPIVGDRDRVFTVCGTSSGGAPEGPPVSIGDELGCVSHDPRLQSEQETGAQFVAAAGSADVRNMWFLMHRRADAMTSEVGVDLIARRRQNRSDGVRYIVSAGVSPETLRKIETGRVATPAFSKIVAVADVLGLSFDTLWKEVSLPQSGSEPTLQAETLFRRLAS